MRTLAGCAPGPRSVDHGKSTLADRLLEHTGTLTEREMTAQVLGSMDLEREKGVTIKASAVRMKHTARNGEVYEMNLIDTPGHVDFTIEVERSLRVLDGAIGVFDAVSGVEPQSETVWHQADRYKVPKLAFINKMDRPGADYWMSVASLKEKLGAHPIPVTIPWGAEDRFQGVIDLLTLKALDDAPGEAFAKTAKLLGLGYPGGPALAKLADSGRPGRFRLPRPMLASGDLDFSFSGLKTAVLTQVRDRDLDDAARADLAAEFQEAVTEVLTAKALAAAARCGLDQLVVAGGVGANRRLRERLDAAAAGRGLSVFYPELELCTDNGAMIAYAGAMRLQAGEAKAAGGFSVRPRWPLQELVQPRGNGYP